MPDTIELAKAGATAPAVVLHTSSGSHRLTVRVADSFFKRFTGLMLTRALQCTQGLLLTRCSSIHTAFMRYAIDVVYLDRAGSVQKCVPDLTPWRGSASQSGRDAQGRRHVRAFHTLELAAGSIARLSIRPGDRLQHPLFQDTEAMPRADGNAVAEAEIQDTPSASQRRTPLRGRRSSRGAAMIEFVVVGPIITLLGLGVLQYGMLFFAKNQINHAAFMATRAGAMGNASLARVQTAYEKALVPLYGGGTSAAELTQALLKAKADVSQNLRIELLNPTKESFDDWNDPALQDTIGGGRRVIPNTGIAAKNPNDIGPASGQSIQDANLIKLRITHGYQPKVPLIRTIYTKYLQWMDTGGDSFYTQLVDAGRIPVVTHATVHMQSDAIEPDDPVSFPGSGNNGNPTDPGDPPGTDNPPPDCPATGCNTDDPPDTPDTPTDPGGGGDGGGSNCTDINCPICDGATSAMGEIQSDVLFPFDKWALADMPPAGLAVLDQMVVKMSTKEFDSIKVIGYTDPLGSEDYNKDLSLKRAATIRDYLVGKGYPQDKISIEGRGETDLKVQLSDCPGGDDAQLKTCLAPNRRVYIVWEGMKNAS